MRRRSDTAGRLTAYQSLAGTAAQAARAELFRIGLAGLSKRRLATRYQPLPGLHEGNYYAHMYDASLAGLARRRAGRGVWVPLWALLGLSGCADTGARTKAPDSTSGAAPVAAPAQGEFAAREENGAVVDGETHQLNRDEPWFEHPAQARPPNGQLPAHTRVRILQDAGSYSKIRTKDGRVCFVASDSLSPLPDH